MIPLARNSSSIVIYLEKIKKNYWTLIILSQKLLYEMSNILLIICIFNF